MKKFLKYFGRLLLLLGITLVWLVIILAMTIRLVCYGPSERARNLFVTTMLETGQMKWVVGLFMSEEDI